MTRLTKKDQDGRWIVPLKMDDGAFITTQMVYDRLAAYEETGVEPEEIHLTTNSRESKHTRHTGYTGRILIFCPKCGTMKSFYTDRSLSHYTCNTCGERTRLEKLKRAYFNCECGMRHRYMTNIWAKLVEMDCFKCGRPMQAEWSKKHCCYQSI